MCNETPSWKLEPWPLPPHPTSIYTCGVTIAPKVCGGKYQNKLSKENSNLKL